MEAELLRAKGFASGAHTQENFSCNVIVRTKVRRLHCAYAS